MKKKEEKFVTPLVYAVKHKIYSQRIESRSGGIFTAVSDYILKKGGVVYGCILDENFKVKHIRAKNIEERNKMRGSKYVQSDLGHIFSHVKEDLEDEKLVLFSGTSCQIAGLKSFIGNQRKNLLCIDIVCHGVPSPKIWDKYLEYQRKMNKGILKKVEFRNKKDFGWASHIETLLFSEKGNNDVSKMNKVNSDVYTTLFYSHNTLRPCCFKCPYKDIIHPGDITIGDYWGINKAAAGFDDNYGVSLVLLNNELGEEYFSYITNEIEYKKCRIEDSLQEPLLKPFPAPNSRKQFWKAVYTLPFEYIVKKYGGQSISTKAKRKVIKIKIGLRKSIRNIIRNRMRG